MLAACEMCGATFDAEDEGHRFCSERCVVNFESITPEQRSAIAKKAAVARRGRSAARPPSTAQPPRCAADILSPGYGLRWAESVIDILSDEEGASIRLNDWSGYGPSTVVRARRVALHAMTSVYAVDISDAAGLLGLKIGTARQALREHRIAHERNNPRVFPPHKAFAHLVEEATYCDEMRDAWRAILVEDVDEIMGWHDPWKQDTV